MGVLLTLLSGVLSGGATGLLGILLQRFFEYKKQQLDLQVIKLNHENAIALAQMESERARMRADADTAIADRNATATENAAASDAAAREAEAASRSLMASYDHDRGQYLEKGATLGKGWPAKVALVLMAIVDFARGMLRPGLTIYLSVIVTIMFTTMLSMLDQRGHQWASAELVPIVTNIVATILYCWTTCVIWWFGTRQSQPVPK